MIAVDVSPALDLRFRLTLPLALGRFVLLGWPDMCLAVRPKLLPAGYVRILSFSLSPTPQQHKASKATVWQVTYLYICTLFLIPQVNHNF